MSKTYTQVAVWRATLVGKENVSGFEEFMKNESSEEYPLYPNLAEIVVLRQW